VLRGYSASKVPGGDAQTRGDAGIALASFDNAKVTTT
jgi:hypothetical protein